MDKKEEFKKFIGKHPEVIKYIKNNETSFQNLFEIYDIYGDDEKVWEKYFKYDDKGDKIGELTNLIKNINLDNVEKYINNAGKAIGILQELTKKTPESLVKVDKPINKYFGD